MRWTRLVALAVALSVCILTATVTHGGRPSITPMTADGPGTAIWPTP